MAASTKGFADGPRKPYRAEGAEVTVHQAKTHLSRLLAEVEGGATIVITRRGKPVATLQPIEGRPKRVFGSMKGMLEIDERFFEPLPEDELRAWEGE
ncbi:type II toxin-antitoxin system Phd/YefM family antitoxin [Enterovirga rhinocerotis]|uniref:Antitoxin n=1 Tax=Enterovirga rhinocerotis TaxID=1339210 RepID=A0A4R7C8M7_9HYPH|nr:type II toxin-antitoxin system prevent-host-death family antitoxin [Enterovirga rhinocerotis]TDR94613.1 prevent-host-death family protein [Enterovirga rhinocerotis]